MLLKVIGERELVVVIKNGTSIKVKPGEVFETHPSNGESYLTNYPLDFDTNDYTKEESPVDPDVQKVLLNGLRDKIKALGGHPVPGNDVAKLEAQIAKLEAAAEEVANADKATATQIPETTTTETKEDETESIEDKTETTTINL